MESGTPTTVYLSLGSNLGDRERNLHEAVTALAGKGVCVVRNSSIYETEPVDFLDQPWFLNCVVEAETTLTPLELLNVLRDLESGMGRKREFAKGPRLLDIDILLYGQETIDATELQVPHPRMAERRFVLVPLAELAPDLRYPAWNATAKELLARSTDHSVVRLFRPSG
jgi:2-amino-4-hydroxy-6-hydroxymethyldihydropteridine diphosphokinase